MQALVIVANGDHGDDDDDGESFDNDRWYNVDLDDDVITGGEDGSDGGIVEVGGVLDLFWHEHLTCVDGWLVENLKMEVSSRHAVDNVVRKWSIQFIHEKSFVWLNLGLKFRKTIMFYVLKYKIPFFTFTLNIIYIRLQ